MELDDTTIEAIAARARRLHLNMTPHNDTTDRDAPACTAALPGTPPTFAELSPPYSTIVADPPWQSKGSGRAFGTRGMAVVQPEAHYSTMDTAGICSLPVTDLAATNAHLYVWVTCSGLADGLAVMSAWGFSYKTCLTWVKEGTLGLGAYFRTMTEHVLFGTRGSLPTTCTDQRNYFTAAKSGHSRKPASFGDLVERSSPGPYVELFARAPRLGWDSWGKGYEIGAARQKAKR